MVMNCAVVGSGQPIAELAQAVKTGQAFCPYTNQVNQRAPQMFNPGDSDNLVTLIRMADSLQQFRYLSVSESSLGGTNSLFIRVSMEDPETWVNNIFHNSAYSIFSIQADSNTGIASLEQISKHYMVPKFRKTRVKNLQQIADKLQAWLAKV